MPSSSGHRSSVFSTSRQASTILNPPFGEYWQLPGEDIPATIHAQQRLHSRRRKDRATKHSTNSSLDSIDSSSSLHSFPPYTSSGESWAELARSIMKRLSEKLLPPSPPPTPPIMANDNKAAKTATVCETPAASSSSIDARTRARALTGLPMPTEKRRCDGYQRPVQRDVFLQEPEHAVVLDGDDLPVFDGRKEVSLAFRTALAP